MKGLDDLFFSGGHPNLRQHHVVPSIFGEQRRLRRAPTKPAPTRLSLAKARTLTDDAIDAFVGDPDIRGKALLVASDPGTGKSTAAARAVKAQKVEALFLFGTMALAEEFALRNGFDLVRGRNAENCERIEVVDALREGGFQIAHNACGTERYPRCHLRSRCPYFAQFEQPGPLVATSEQLYNPAALRTAKLVILDDADLLRVAIARVQVRLEDLSRAIEFLARNRGEGNVLALLRLLRDALESRPANGLLGSRVWDHLSQVAHQASLDLPALVRVIEPRKLPALDPKAQGDESLSVEDVKRVPPATIRELVLALIEELPRFESGEDFNSRIRLVASGFEVGRLREHVETEKEGRLIDRRALLILDATPLPSLIDHISRHHARLPDVHAPVELPANVHITQYFVHPNGHRAMGTETARQAVKAAIEDFRTRHPLDAEDEAVIGYKGNREFYQGLGFPEDRILHFGAARGTNALEDVHRLFVVGRPMHPPPEYFFIAQVIHHNDVPISDEIVLRPQYIEGTGQEVDVFDFVDPRMAELLRATRDDEMSQVIYRARPTSMPLQASFEPDGRERLHIVVLTSHAVPGLRVNEIIEADERIDINQQRQSDADIRIGAAIERLERMGPASLNAIANEARADKRTVRAYLARRTFGEVVDTPKEGRHGANDDTGANGEAVDTPVRDISRGIHHLSTPLVSTSCACTGCPGCANEATAPLCRRARLEGNYWPRMGRCAWCKPFRGTG